MKEFLTKNKDKILTMLLITIIFLMTYLISDKIIPLLDDISYTFEHSKGAIMEPDYSKRLISLSQIIKNQILEYKLHNGRFLINIFVSTILMNNFGWYKVINSLVMVVCVVSISRIATGKINNYVILFTYSMMFLLSYEIKRQTIYWLTGAANYFWITSVFLVFLIPLADQITKRRELRDFFKNKFILLCWCILAFIVGQGTNIVSLFGLGFLTSTLICLIMYKSDKQNYKYLLIISFFFLIGLAFLWLAPGNYVRSNEMGITYSSFENIKYALSLLIKISYLTDFNFTAILAIISSLLIFKYNKKLGILVFLFFSPLILVMVTRNQYIYWELPERYISLIYPDLINNTPSYYANVSWNLQYYFYGFYTALFVVIYIWLFIKDNNILISLLFFAGLCGNLTRITIPVGSERTCLYSDLLYLVVFSIYQSQSKRSALIISLLLVINIVFNFNIDYKIYSRDYRIYQKRQELINACMFDTNCESLVLPAYSPRGYYSGAWPGWKLSPHTSMVSKYYGVNVLSEKYDKND